MATGRVGEAGVRAPPLAEMELTLDRGHALIQCLIMEVIIAQGPAMRLGFVTPVLIVLVCHNVYV